MSVYTEAVAARSAALAARDEARWQSAAGGFAAAVAYRKAKDVYNAACAEVETIEAGMERAL